MSGADFGGLRLGLLTEINELASASLDHPCDLRVAVRDTPAEAPSCWTHQWTTDDDDIVLSLGRFRERHVLRFENGALFEFDRYTRTVRCPPLDPMARHQLLDHVLPRVLDDLGHLMIHGSAVDTPNGAIVFVGDSGLGKSTLAASFQSTGGNLLSDDCMRLAPRPDATVSCRPTYRSLRLWPDSVCTLMATAQSEPMSATQEKRRVKLPDELTPATSATVAAICVLAAPSPGFCGVELNELPPSQAVSSLLSQCFRLDPTDNEATKRVFERVADVVENVPVVELVYDRSYDRLPEVRDAVLRCSADVGSAPITSA